MQQRYLQRESTPHVWESITSIIWWLLPLTYCKHIKRTSSINQRPKAWRETATKKVSSSNSTKQQQQQQQEHLDNSLAPCVLGKKWPPYTANKVIAERRLRPPVQHSMLQICPPENKLKSIWLCHTVTILRRITFFLYKKFKFCKESSSCQKCFHPNIVLILHKCGRHPNIAKQKPVNFLWCSPQSCSAAAVPK